MSYNNYPAYNQGAQQQQQYQHQATDTQQHQRYQQQQYVNRGPATAPTGQVPRGNPPPPPPLNPQHQYPAGMDSQQYASAWSQQQHQQNLMRYSVQPQPPTYPPPAYAYPQYHSYPQSPPVPPPRGYYAYPQPPAPAAVSAYGGVGYQAQAGLRQAVPPGMYLQGSAGVPPPPPPITAPEIQPRTSDPPIPPVEAKSEQIDNKEVKAKQPIVVGKRRGGRVLPTGVVKKQKIETAQPVRKDPWSQYMHEVKRYKDESCDDDNRKNRPLVK